MKSMIAEAPVLFNLSVEPQFKPIQRVASLRTGTRYTPSDCFETFPFPDGWGADGSVEAAGRSYYEYRAALMVENDEGMTKTYNRFNDIYETDPRIVELRELHTAMDRAVLNAYGWADIATDCEFLLDHAIDEATWGRKKKPYRYRWPDPARDEVLARLLALNAERAQDEGRTPAEGRTAPRRRRRTQFDRALTPISMNSDASGSPELDAIVEPHG